MFTECLFFIIVTSEVHCPHWLYEAVVFRVTVCTRFCHLMMCNQSHLLRIWSKRKNTTAYICIKGLTECSQVQVSINTFNGFAEESFGKTLTCYICSLIQFGKELQINYENTKTRLTTQQIHPSLCLFTGHTCSTVNT